MGSIFLTLAERCQELVNGQEREGQTPTHTLAATGSCFAQQVEQAEKPRAAKRSHAEFEHLFQHFPLAKVTASTPVAN